MKKQSAGILVYRFENGMLQVLLVHPGGPFWAKKEDGAWSIPKGEFETTEDPLNAAMRELEEETGLKAMGPFISLKQIRLKSGKIVLAWAFQSDFDVHTTKSNLFEMEWPPRSGLMKSFPEVDKAEWFAISQAKQKINVGQIPLIAELEEQLQAGISYNSPEF